MIPTWTEKLPFLSVDLLQARIAWSIRLRWLSIAGFYLGTLMIKYVYALPIQYDYVWILLNALAVINLIYYIVAKIFKEFSFPWEIKVLLIHAFIDLIFLTAIVHLTGGIENPIYLFYVFHVVISSIIFPGSIPFILATFVVFMFGGLLYAEYAELVNHYSIFNSNIHQNELAVIVTFAVFGITVYVSTYICTTFMVVYRNIKHQVDEQNKQLVEADKEKTQFYQFTSHELKSPIIAVKSTIDGINKLYKNKIDEKIIELLQRASNRCMQMLDIIKELLIITQSKSDTKQVQLSKVSLHKIIEELVLAEKNTAAVNNIKIFTDFKAQFDLVLAKKSDIINIIDNLISNAIRYNKDNGEINISTSNQNNYIKMNISDTGIGIPNQDIDKIFSEFYRSENAKKKISYGTGLGLSLIKQLVENYNGKIEVSSEINHGTTFSIRFPTTNGEKQ